MKLGFRFLISFIVLSICVIIGFGIYFAISIANDVRSNAAKLAAAELEKSGTSTFKNKYNPMRLFRPHK